MSFTVHRLHPLRHAGSAWRGDGGLYYAGRWNRKGTPLVYAAATRSLATLELLVHLHKASRLKIYGAAFATIPDGLTYTLVTGALPKNWRSPAAYPACQAIAQQWIDDAESPVLEVPSAVEPQELCYLLNPRHPHFKRIKTSPLKPLALDPRIAGLQRD